MSNYKSTLQKNTIANIVNIMTFRQIMFLLALTVSGLAGCKQQQSVEIRNDFRKYYDRFNVEGSFVLYDPMEDKYIVYNREQTTQQFTTASTFKICNSLIGLETGVIKDENFVIPWDSVVRQYPGWNSDHDLKTAFKNSTVWYYQELARRVGGQQMKHWLDTAQYGNADTSGGIDKFWLQGGLRITPMQQIDFLRRLHDNKLPFSQRSMDIVKKIMIAKDTLDYVVRAKTGWGIQDNKNIGWYVGYLETKDNVYYFANCIQTGDNSNKDFVRARIDITYMILDELKLTKK
jgi:beta-lactamase class D